MNRSNPSRSRAPSAGIGLRGPHCADLIAARPTVGFLEVHTENYLGGGAPLRTLETVRRDWPVSLHGVGLSLGSADGIDRDHLERIAALVDRIAPALVSEHLSWSTAGGAYLNDLLPLPYTEEMLGIVARNVDAMQTRLKRQVLLENPSSYLAYRGSTMTEAEFLAALVRRAGCGVLCDVNNIFVSDWNVGGNARAYLDTLPAEAIAEIHLAGHSLNDADGVWVMIDDHGSQVSGAVWSLYEAAVRQFPYAATLVEWDSNLPPLETLVAEAAEADLRRAATLEESNAAAA